MLNSRVGGLDIAIQGTGSPEDLVPFHKNKCNSSTFLGA